MCLVSSTTCNMACNLWSGLRAMANASSPGCLMNMSPRLIRICSFGKPTNRLMKFCLALNGILEHDHVPTFGRRKIVDEFADQDAIARERLLLALPSRSSTSRYRHSGQVVATTALLGGIRPASRTVDRLPHRRFRYWPRPDTSNRIPDMPRPCAVPSGWEPWTRSESRTPRPQTHETERRESRPARSTRPSRARHDWAASRTGSGVTNAVLAWPTRQFSICS